MARPLPAMSLHPEHTTHALSASTKTCSLVASLQSHKDHFNYNLPKIKLQTIGIAGKVSALLARKNWSPKGLVSRLFLYGILAGMIFFPFVQKVYSHRS